MKIIVVDDDKLIVQSLKTIIEASGLQVVGSGNSGSEAVQLVRDLAADILLMDIRMPGMDGLEAAREILKQDSEVKILLLTTFKDAEYISEALALGCKGYLLKQNFASLIPALHSVAAGNLVFDQEVMDSYRRRELIEDDPRLSERQNEVLKLLAEGLSNREIAERLHLSEGTVRNNLSQILNILGLRDRTQVVIDFYRRLLR